MTKIVNVATVAVPVADQDRAVKFYTETLGFEKRMEAEFGGGMRWIEVGPPDSATTIALPPLGNVKPGQDTGIRLVTESAEADHEALRAQGVDVGDLLNFPGAPPMFSFKDADGNTLYVVERM
jgi:catechol 2,3-dioxygenase-like lactoylglutathione lyase family enzyme